MCIIFGYTTCVAIYTNIALFVDDKLIYCGRHNLKIDIPKYRILDNNMIPINYGQIYSTKDDFTLSDMSNIILKQIHIL